MLNQLAVACPKCGTVLPESFYNRGTFEQCPRCQAGVRCEVFPAYHHGPSVGRAGEALVDASEASCFFHPEKRASVACDTCGRFLCALCDLDFAGRHICPSCLSSGRKKGTMGDLEQSRFSWSGLALMLTLVPLLAYPITCVTAPAALVIAIIGLRKPPSITGQRRIFSAIVAILGSLVQIAAWVRVLKVYFGA